MAVIDGAESEQTAEITTFSQQLEPPKLTTDAAVHIHVTSKQKCFIYDVEDAKKLRLDHHICGTLVGTLPQVAQQNVFLGLPLQLSPEEVSCLVKNGLAVLVSSASSHFPPTIEDAAAYARCRISAAAEHRQQAAADEQHARQRFLIEKADEIAMKRKLKAEARRHQALTDASGTLEPLFSSDESKTFTTSVSNMAIIDDIPSKHSFPISIPSTSNGLPWYDAIDTYSDLDKAANDGVYIYPPIKMTTEQVTLARARCDVYEDLWKKGYFLGSGLKFGGDFLAYPGDPLRFHSHFTVTVMQGLRASINPLDIVAWGRLATAVKKSHLFSIVNADNVINYITLEWAGFG